MCLAGLVLSISYDVCNILSNYEKLHFFQIYIYFNTTNISLHLCGPIPGITYDKSQHLHSIFLKVRHQGRHIGQNSFVLNMRLNAGPTLECVLPKTSMFNKSISYQGPRTWTDLPADVRNISDLDMFKLYIKGRTQTEFNDMLGI